jgi:hypothetical protein
MGSCLSVVLGVVLGVPACKPNVGQPPSLVTDYALLAVRGEPPEAKPGSSVTYSFLLASPIGTIDSADALWDICQTPKPPSESNAVSSACASAPDAGTTTTGQTYTAAIPAKACQLFGPIAPPPAAGQPSIRPRDPDSTGGYFLPVQLWLPNVTTTAISGFAMERITCNLANASSDIIAKYSAEYTPNNDPLIDHAVIIDASGNSLSLDAGEVPLSSGSAVTIEAGLVDGSAETFPVYNLETESLSDQVESLHLFWFATGGSFERDRTTVDPGALTTSNRWTLPSGPGAYYLWIVVRDSRGGTDFKSYQVAVAP